MSPRVLPLMCVPSVARAIREGRQTVDRRPISGSFPEGYLPVVGEEPKGRLWRFTLKGQKPQELVLPEVPSWPPAVIGATAPWARGDVLWVRERARVVRYDASSEPHRVLLRYEADKAEAWADYPERLKYTQPGRCVPNGVHREGARTWLKVLEVRPVRIEATTVEEALAEGCPRTEEYPLIWFRHLWEKLYPHFPMHPGGWVWRTSVERCERPEYLARAA